jgi:hypothetical protein
MEETYLSFLLARIRGPVEDEPGGLARLAVLDEALEEVAEGEAWATLQAARANILVQMPGARVGEYMEQAIEAYRSALRYRTRELDPSRWAHTMSTSAAAWCRRVKGDRSENLERALACLTEIGDSLDKDPDPTLWALARANSGNAYFQRLVGDPRDNIERAIG